jgi:hypothetical protein
MEHRKIWAGALSPMSTSAISLNREEVAHPIEGLSLGRLVVRHSRVKELPRVRVANEPLPKIDYVLCCAALDELIEESNNRSVHLVERHGDHDIAQRAASEAAASCE